MYKKRRALILAAIVGAILAVALRLGDAGYGSTLSAYDPPDRQIVFSMGKKPNTIFISWSGNRYGPSYLRYAYSPENLTEGRVVAAVRQRILGSSWYRYSVKIKTRRGIYYQTGDGMAYDTLEFFEQPHHRLGTRFIFIGDMQLKKESPQWQKMIEGALGRDRPLRDAGGEDAKQGKAISHSPCDFVVLGGDMVNVPTKVGEWKIFLDNCRALEGLPVMAAAGNHEGVHSNITYGKIFRLPQNGPKKIKNVDLGVGFYYFDKGLCRITVLDSSFMTDARRKKLGFKGWRSQNKKIMTWLDKTTGENSKLWNIVVLHHPPYGMHNDKRVSERVRELWVPIIEDAGVDLVLSGHQHLYMRTRPINGIVYVMGNSGERSSEFYDGVNKPFYADCIYHEGPGYQIIEAGLNGLRISAYNEKGFIIDEAMIKKSILLHIFKFFSGL